MKIKCANCEQKVISFKDAFFNFDNTSCSNCGSHLEFKSTKAYGPLANLNIILTFFIVIITENGQLNKPLGYLIIAVTFIGTLFFTTQTTLREKLAPKSTKTQNKKRRILLITVVAAALLYIHLHYDLKMSDERLPIRGLQIFLILSNTYLIYTTLKNKKK